MNNINKILKDLYKLEPDLKKDEEKLIKIIEALLENKPNIKLDKKFYQELKKDLLKKSIVNKNSFKFNFMSIRKQLYLGGLVLAVVFAVVFVSTIPSRLNAPGDGTKLSFVSSVESLKKNAFGPLSAGSIESSLEVTESFIEPSFGGEIEERGVFNGSSIQGSSPVAQGAGNEAVSSFVDNEVVSDLALDSQMIMPYEPYSYNYILSDDGFELNDSELEVLKKTKKPLNSFSSSPFLSGFDFDIINLESFDNLEIDNLSLSEDKDFGYSIYINFREGNISVSENWQKWRVATEEQFCVEGNCRGANKLKISDIPNDQQIIKMADNFISDKNIDMKQYGKGIVDDSWKDNYERSPSKENYYIPEVISVVYPLKVFGKEIYDQRGSYSGLRVSINVRHSRVSGLYGLEEIEFQSSKYEAETDKNKIIDIVKKGGVNTYQPEDGKVLDIVLGSPTISYVRTWNYSDGDNSELFVPSLVFPVLEVPDGVYFYKKVVIVPLIKEMLENVNNFIPSPILRMESPRIELQTDSVEQEFMEK